MCYIIYSKENIKQRRLGVKHFDNLYYSTGTFENVLGLMDVHNTKSYENYIHILDNFAEHPVIYNFR